MNNKLKVTVQTHDGTVFEFDAYSCSFCGGIPEPVSCEYSHAFDGIGMMRQQFEFEVINEITHSLNDDIVQQIETNKSKAEWLCGWCGSPNERKDKQCTQCGGARSFVYG